MMWQSNLLWAVLLLFLGTGCGTPEIETLPYYASADFTPRWIDHSSPAIDSIPQIAPFTVVNQSGRTITDKNFAGKVYVADFIFTSCSGICPDMTSNMLKVQEAFKHDDEIMLISYSVAPETDSVEALRTYAEMNGLIEGKWHVVTGDRQVIYGLARYSYFADEDLGESRSENEFLHTENFFLVDRQKRIRGIYNGVMPSEIAKLIGDIRKLKKDPAG